jgi:hypothetical protein
VATIVIARWEGVLDRPRLGAELAAGSRAIVGEPVVGATLEGERI